MTCIPVATLLLLSLTTTPAKQAFTSIRQIDFKNFIYPWDDSYDGPSSTWAWLPLPSSDSFRLSHGKRWLRDPGAEPTEQGFTLLFMFESVAYGVLSGEQRDVAAVSISYSTGGTAGWGYLYVYRLANGKPTLMGYLITGSRADGGLVKVAFQDGELVLDFEDPAKRVGDCCSTGYIRVHYRWQNNHFIEAGPREHGDLPLNVFPQKQ